MALPVFGEDWLMTRAGWVANDRNFNKLETTVEKEDAGLLRQLTLEEYKSLRSESAQAKSIQQTVVQWSLGSLAVLGAGVAAVFSAMAQSGRREELFPVLIVLLAGAIPSVCLSAFAVWCGELQRMERTGYSLRARERAWLKQAHLTGKISTEDMERAPALWENFLVLPELPRVLGKNRVGTIGIIALYTLATLISLASAWAVSYAHPYARGFHWVPYAIQSVLFLYLLPLVSIAAQLNSVRKVERVRLDAPFSVSPIPVTVAPRGDDDVWASVDLILPILNEVAAIPWMLSRTPWQARVIAVDNGSSDGSGELAKSYGAVTVYEARPGVEMATVAGLRRATRPYVIVSDCDGTVDPVDLVALVVPIANGQADLVIGARRPREHAQTKLLTITNRILAYAIGRRIGVTLSDLGSARAMSLECAREFQALNAGNGWSVASTLHAAGSGRRVIEVPIAYYPRAGSSKITGSARGYVRTVLDVAKVLRREFP